MGLLDTIEEKKKLRDLKKFFPNMDVAYTEDNGNIILIIKSYLPNYKGGFGDFYFDYRHYYDAKKRFSKCNIIFRIEDLVISEDSINIIHDFSLVDRIQFVNCTFKNDIHKLKSNLKRIEFIDCKFEGEMTLKTSVFDGQEIKFNNCIFEKIIHYASSYIGIITVSFENCNFKDEVLLCDPDGESIYFIEFANCNFDSNLVTESKFINVRDNIINGNTVIRTNVLTILGILKAKNIYLKSKKLGNNFNNFNIEATDSAKIEGGDNDKYIISSPCVIYNGYDITTDNNSLMDEYPNEKYKRVIYDNSEVQMERQRLLCVLLNIREMALKEIEDKKIEYEKKLLNEPLMK